MAGWVYLTKNHELHKIGMTRDIRARLAQIKPTEIVGIYTVSDPEYVERTLHRMFKAKRLPQSEYFRLNSDEERRAKTFLEKYNLNAIPPIQNPISSAAGSSSGVNGDISLTSLQELKKQAAEAKVYQFFVNNTEQLLIDEAAAKQQYGDSRESKVQAEKTESEPQISITSEPQVSADDDGQPPSPEPIAKPRLSDYFRDFMLTMLIVGLLIGASVLGFRLFIAGITGLFHAIFF